MRTAPLHSIEVMKIRLTYGHLRDATREQLTTLYKKIRESAETDDIVLLMWVVLVTVLVYTGYSKFSECGKIIGLYKELRF
jgi:hypothetical protein